jgi:hypothetical protein
MKILIEIVPNETLPRHVLARIEEKAKAMGISPEELAGRILKKAAESEELPEQPVAAAA